jgi:type I restriction enzyme, S subunit
MSRISDLIADLCPSGVEFRELGDLLDYEQPTKYLVSSTAYDDSYTTPVLTAGQTYILGYTDESSGIFPATPDEPVIIFDDFTTAFRWVNFPFKAKSSALKMLHPQLNARVEFRFVYYAMLCIRFTPSEHARHWISLYSKFRIPVPPLAVQREVVTVLDAFVALDVELAAEREARRQQYEYYRNSLLTFERESVRWATLGDVATFERGRAITAKETTAGGVPVVANGPAPIYSHSESNRTGETVVVARSGAYAGFVSFWDQPIFLTDAFSIHPALELLRPKFVYYWLRARQEGLHAMKKGSGVPHVRVKDFESYELPVPSLDEQERIIAILDKFAALVNDPSVGLPAELTARRKQYEYYRNRLLTFPETA